MGFDDFTKSLNKKFGKDNTSSGAGVRSLSANPIVVQAISTGSMQIDRFTGIGGFPRGYISQIFGSPATGKTTLAYSTIREAQRQGFRCAYIDAEFSFNPRWAAQQGVDVSDDKLLFAQPEIGEVALDLVEEIVRNAQDHNIAVVVVDSISALIPRKQLAAATVSDDFIASLANLMKKAMGRLKSVVAQSNVALIFINHLKTSIGMTYGDPRTRPGGKDVEFYCSLMMEVRKGDKLEDGGTPIGTTIKVAMYKNRFAGFAKTEVPEVRVYIQGGINKAYELLQVAVDLGVVIKSGAWFKFNDEIIGQGEDKTTKRLETDEELYRTIEGLVNAIPM